MDGHTLGVDGSEVGADRIGVSSGPSPQLHADSLLEERDEVGLGRLLESHDGRGLEAKVGLEVLGNLADKALEAAGDQRVSDPTPSQNNKGRRTGACG